MNVIELRDILADLPDDMPVKVSHEPLVQHIGDHEPKISVKNIVGIASVNEKGVPAYDYIGEQWLIVE